MAEQHYSHILKGVSAKVIYLALKLPRRNSALS